jgi:hypothetical protein
VTDRHRNPEQLEEFFLELKAIMVRRTINKNKKTKRTGLRKSSDPKTRFRPGTKVECSGIYEAFHALHRISHEVTLIAGHEFPPCSRCRDKVRFELVRANSSLNETNSPLVHVIGVFLPEAA